MENRDKRIEHTDTLPGLKIGKYRSDLPIVQGGMGIGISLHQLAGNVALHGGIGTLSFGGIHKLPQYKEYRKNLCQQKKIELGGKIAPEEYKKLINEADAYCIADEIRKAKEISGGRGAIFANFLKAATYSKEQILAACAAGIDGIVCGAGRPSDLPEITKEYPNIALIPIVSNLQGARIMVRYRQRYDKTPDALIIEDPSRAGGHLGAGSLDKVNDPENTLEVALPKIIAYLKEEGLSVPLIAAGGIVDKDDVSRVMKLGASGVQLGTRFLASEESGASKKFKNAIINAKEEDIFTYMSNTGIPARALKNSDIFKKVAERKAETRNCIENCLKRCGFRDGIATLTQMCIFKELVKSTEGGDGGGLMFTGVSAREINSIKTVEEIMKTFE